MGIFCRKKRVHILKIRKINIHDSFQCLDGIHILIASRIVYTVKSKVGVPVTVTLKEDTEVLDEVVVVGYGTQKKVNLTGAESLVAGE